MVLNYALIDTKLEFTKSTKPLTAKHNGGSVFYV
jgi:hypothetical protein